MLLPVIGFMSVALCRVCSAKPIPVRTEQSWPARAGAPLSLNEVFRVTEIGGVAVDRGGRKVAFTTLSADPSCNCYHVMLHVLSVPTDQERDIANLGQPFPTSDPDGSINGWPTVGDSQWSRNGRYLAYLVNMKGRGRLFVYDAMTHKSKQLDLGRDEPFGFTWNDSSDVLIYQTGGPTRESIDMLNSGKINGYLWGRKLFFSNPSGMPVIPRVPEASVFRGLGRAVFGRNRAWSDLKTVSVPGNAIGEATISERHFASHAAFSYLEQPDRLPKMVSGAEGRFT